MPPPTAMQKVSDRQESEVNPPPGGTVLRSSVQPAAGLTGVGTVVGTADGAEVGTDVDEEVLDVRAPLSPACLVAEGWWVRYLAAVWDEHPQAISAGTTNQIQPRLRRPPTWVACGILPIAPPQTGSSRVLKTMPVRGFGWK